MTDEPPRKRNPHYDPAMVLKPLTVPRCGIRNIESPRRASMTPASSPPIEPDRSNMENQLVAHLFAERDLLLDRLKSLANVLVMDDRQEEARKVEVERIRLEQTFADILQVVTR